MKTKGYVYVFYSGESEALYVGQTIDVVQRFNAHKYEELWMDEVEKIEVHGPYDSTNLINYFEECYIRMLKPRYNLDFNHEYESIPFTDNFGIARFDNEAELTKYFEEKEEGYKRCTFYLRVDQVETIREFAFKNRMQKSELLRNIIDAAL